MIASFGERKRSTAGESGSRETATDIYGLFGPQLPDGPSQTEQILAHFIFANRGRVGREMIDLRRRGNLNLIIGISTTICGVVILGYVVFGE